MAMTLLEYQTRLLWNGQEYRARACGREVSGNTWEGWLEFVPADDGPVIPSSRETTQPNLTDLEYWATGLTPVYLEGALERSVSRSVRPVPPPVEPPAYDGPAAPRPAPDDVDVVRPVLDPFSVYAKGEDLLRQQLGALSARHLRRIIRAYRLVDPGVDVERLTPVELVALVMTGVRKQAV